MSSQVTSDKSVEESEHNKVRDELTSLQDTAMAYTRVAHSLTNQLSRNEVLTDMLSRPSHVQN